MGAHPYVSQSLFFPPATRELIRGELLPTFAGEGKKEGRRKEGRKEKGKKKSDRDEENKHDSREMLKVRMHSIPRIASLSAEQTRRRRKKRASVECKGRLKMLAPIQRGDFSYSDFVYMLNHHP